MTLIISLYVDVIEKVQIKDINNTKFIIKY